MSLFESDVEYFDEISDDLNHFKKCSFDDDKFREFIDEFGSEHALYVATTLHRELADQLHSNNLVGDAGWGDEWKRKIVGLVIVVKRRRQQLRRVVREVHGEMAINHINDRVLRESEDVG